MSVRRHDKEASIISGIPCVPLTIKSIMIVLLKFLALFYFNEFRYGWLNLNEILIVLPKVRKDISKYQHIWQSRSGQREVTSYKVTSFRTSYQIEVCSFANKKRKKLKIVLHATHKNVIA